MKTKSIVSLSLVLTVILVANLGASFYHPPHVWLDADGNPLPFQSHKELTQFLTTAEIVERKKIGIGINGIDKLLLAKDGIRVYAGFRDVQISKLRERLANGRIYLNFRDDCIFEAAAYRLNRLLDLDMVPPTVRRKVYGKWGTLQLWVEDAIMELDRVKKKIAAPNRVQWYFQVQTMYLFDRLIQNDDRNQGNILMTENGRLWMIDHTRSFRPTDDLEKTEKIHRCSRDLLARLRELTREELDEHLGDLLTGKQIKYLLLRRDKLVEHVDSLIEERGSTQVLF